MIREAFDWLRTVIALRKAEKLDVATQRVTMFQAMLPDGTWTPHASVPKRAVALTVTDVDSFVLAVKELFHQRYGDLPFDGPQEPDKPPVVHRKMPVMVTVYDDGAVARLMPTDECRRKAADMIQTGTNQDDVVKLVLSPSVPWQRLLAYASGTRVKQADIVREWEDVWQDCTYHRLADKFRRIEIQTRSEVTTGPRRDAGMQEFVTKADDELPESVELSVQRWAEYRVSDSFRPKIEARIQIERSQPPLVSLQPIIGAMDAANLESKRNLRRDLEGDLDLLAIPVVLGAFGSKDE